MHEHYLQLAFELAKKAGSRTYPNPLVGAVIVKSGKVIGKGYHQKFGGKHAEINALKNCKASPKGADLYVNLEPCCHHGKQPPCTDAIIRAGIRRVVFCMYDPNPAVKQKSSRQMKKAGVEVISEILKKPAERLNEIYMHYQKTGAPFVALKIASSLDGKIATENGDSKWITNEKARRYARSMRGEYQAILIGANTAIKDNPHLGARKKSAKDPLRIIIDPHGRVPKQAQAFRDENYLHIKDKKFSLRKLLNSLAKQGIISVLVEGGAFTLSSFLTAKLAQKIYWFYAPIIIGGARSFPTIQTPDILKVRYAPVLKNCSYKTIGDNFLFEGYFS